MLSSLISESDTHRELCIVAYLPHVGAVEAIETSKGTQQCGCALEVRVFAARC
jgi:hypothetical protein